jgi:ABC-type oligopeptide transport system substrate-binding subunit
MSMRSSFRYLAAAAAMFALAACGDTTTSPRETSARSFAPSVGPAFDYSGGGERQSGDQSSDFTVTARGGSFSVNGLFTINFPANSVCNPDRSSYGTGEWEKSCSTLRSDESIKVKAKLRLTSAGVAVDFSPELRFSPNTEVTLSTDIFSQVLKANRDYYATHPGSLNFLAISFSPTLGSAAVADYSVDKSLITHIDLRTGNIWRRIKHFSGYLMSSGEACTPSAGNPDCVDVNSDGG